MSIRRTLLFSVIQNFEPGYEKWFIWHKIERCTDLPTSQLKEYYTSDCRVKNESECLNVPLEYYENYYKIKASVYFPF